MTAAAAVPLTSALERRPVAAAVKRALDIVGGALLLLAAGPLMLALTLAIWIGSGRPLLYRQERVGRGGRHFRLAKLRTMVPDAEEQQAALRARSADLWLLLDDDPRVTRLGRVMRRYSLDELPQFVHVVSGRMSLVGPRPLSLEDDACVPVWARARSDVRPGLTGPWQVSGRTNLPFRQMLELDLAYVRDWSLRHDLTLLRKTLPAVLTSRGAN